MPAGSRRRPRDDRRRRQLPRRRPDARRRAARALPRPDVERRLGLPGQRRDRRRARRARPATPRRRSPAAAPARARAAAPTRRSTSCSPPARTCRSRACRSTRAASSTTSGTRQPVAGSVVTLDAGRRLRGLGTRRPAWSRRRSAATPSNGSAVSMTVGADGFYQFLFAPAAPASCTLRPRRDAAGRLPVRVGADPAGERRLRRAGDAAARRTDAAAGRRADRPRRPGDDLLPDLHGRRLGDRLDPQPHPARPGDADRPVALEDRRPRGRRGRRLGALHDHRAALERRRCRARSRWSTACRPASPTSPAPRSSTARRRRPGRQAGPGAGLQPRLDGGGGQARAAVPRARRRRRAAGRRRQPRHRLRLRRAGRLRRRRRLDAAGRLGGRPTKAATASRVTGGVFTTEACVPARSSSTATATTCRTPRRLGIPGVRLVLQRRHLRWSATPKASTATAACRRESHVLRVDETTLPRGSRLTTASNRNLGDAGSLWLDLKNGELHRADFIEGSCSAPVLDQVKARRAQGEVRSVETEKPSLPPLRFDSKAHGAMAEARRARGPKARTSRCPGARHGQRARCHHASRGDAGRSLECGALIVLPCAAACTSPAAAHRSSLAGDISLAQGRGVAAVRVSKPSAAVPTGRHAGAAPKPLVAAPKESAAVRGSNQAHAPSKPVHADGDRLRPIDGRAACVAPRARRACGGCESRCRAGAGTRRHACRAVVEASGRGACKPACRGGAEAPSRRRGRLRSPAVGPRAGAAEALRRERSRSASTGSRLRRAAGGAGNRAAELGHAARPPAGAVSCKHDVRCAGRTADGQSERRALHQPTQTSIPGVAPARYPGAAGEEAPALLNGTSISGLDYAPNAAVGRIVVEIDRDAVPADGQSPVQVSVRVYGRDDKPLATPVLLTIEHSGGRVLLPGARTDEFGPRRQDADRTVPGVQLQGRGRRGRVHAARAGRGAGRAAARQRREPSEAAGAIALRARAAADGRRRPGRGHRQLPQPHRARPGAPRRRLRAGDRRLVAAVQRRQGQRRRAHRVLPQGDDPRRPAAHRGLRLRQGHAHAPAARHPRPTSSTRSTATPRCAASTRARPSASTCASTAARTTSSTATSSPATASRSRSGRARVASLKQRSLGNYNRTATGLRVHDRARPRGGERVRVPRLAAPGGRGVRAARARARTACATTRVLEGSEKVEVIVRDRTNPRASSP